MRVEYKFVIEDDASKLDQIEEDSGLQLMLHDFAKKYRVAAKLETKNFRHS